MEAFLTKQERSHVQRMYVKWVNYLQPRNVGHLLYDRELIRDREKQELDAKKTDYERSEYLFEIAVIRATYPQIQGLRAILVEDNQIELARQLPCRSNDPFWERYAARSKRNMEPPPCEKPPPPRPTQSKYEPMDTDGHQTGAHFNASTQSPTGAGPSSRDQNRSDGLGPRSNITEPSADTMPAARSERHPQGVPVTTSSPPETAQQSHTAMSNPHQAPRANTNINSYNHHTQSDTPGSNNAPQAQGPNIPVGSNRIMRGPATALKSKLGFYATTGQGYCLIIANFTKDMPGYERDIFVTEYFFRNILGCKVVTEKNLKKDDIKYILERTQNELKEATSNYDRLFIFIMSHGNEKGITTCKPDGETPEYVFVRGNIQKENNEPLTEKITAEEIVATFTHDKVSKLKSLPKVFFIQTCQGNRNLATAAGGAQPKANERLVRGAAIPDPPTDITIGADTLVCKASQPNCFAWVDENGSWLIQEAISTFISYYKTEHLVDMITEINQRISRKCAKNDLRQEVYQLPSVAHNLTKKLYFVNP